MCGVGGRELKMEKGAGKRGREREKERERERLVTADGRNERRHG